MLLEAEVLPTAQVASTAEIRADEAMVNGTRSIRNFSNSLNNVRMEASTSLLRPLSSSIVRCLSSTSSWTIATQMLLSSSESAKRCLRYWTSFSSHGWDSVVGEASAVSAAGGGSLGKGGSAPAGSGGHSPAEELADPEPLSEGPATKLSRRLHSPKSTKLMTFNGLDDLLLLALLRSMGALSKSRPLNMRKPPPSESLPSSLPESGAA